MSRDIKSIITLNLLLSFFVFAGEAGAQISSETRISHPAYQMSNIGFGVRNVWSRDYKRIMMFEVTTATPDYNEKGRGLVWGFVDDCDNHDCLTEWNTLDEYKDYASPVPGGADITQSSSAYWSPFEEEENIIYAPFTSGENGSWLKKINVDTEAIEDVVSIDDAVNGEIPPFQRFTCYGFTDKKELICSIQGESEGYGGWNYGGYLIDVKAKTKKWIPYPDFWWNPAFTCNTAPPTRLDSFWDMPDYVGHGHQGKNPGRTAWLNNYGGADYGSDFINVKGIIKRSDCSVIPDHEGNIRRATHVSWLSSDDYFIASTCGDRCIYHDRPFLETYRIYQVNWDGSKFSYAELLSKQSAGRWQTRPGAADHVNFDAAPVATIRKDGKQLIFSSTDGKYTYSDHLEGGGVTPWGNEGIFLVNFSGHDTSKPAISITAPTSEPDYTTGASSLATLAGTASDNEAVTEVTWSNNRGGSGTAIGTGNWSATDIELQTGVNIITVTAHDSAGNSDYDAIAINRQSDLVPPVAAACTPPNGATDVSVNTNLVMAFNENIAKGSGKILIKKTVDDSTAQAIDVSSGRVIVDGASVEILLSDLENDAGYYIVMPGGVLTDAAAPAPNAFPGISDKAAWSFATAAAPPVASFYSDDFDPATDEANPVWRFYDPYDTTAEDDPGQSAVSFDGTSASIAIPAGLTHDLWPGFNKAPRLLQHAADADLSIEAKFASTVSSKHQLQGVVIQQTGDILMRFDVVHDGVSPRLFAAYFNGDYYKVFAEKRLSETPLFLRVLRSGDQWTYLYSFDGNVWDEAAAFSQKISVMEAGFFAGTHDPAPAFTARVDYFLNMKAPDLPAPPAISTQPADQTVKEGLTARFSVVADGAGLSYQWKRNGWSITGATNASYVTGPLSMADSGAVFSCVVRNRAGGVFSSPAVLTVAAAMPPVIAVQPADQSVAAGQPATFSVAAAGAGPISYQWMRDGANIEGATGPSYTTAPTDPDDDGAAFSCAVSNSAGSADSNPAFLTIRPAVFALLSDDFNPATAEPNPAWRFHDPYNATVEADAGESVLSFDGADASIAIPAGLSHNLWTGAENKAPRVLQPVANADFGVEVKFESTPSSRYQMQGIVVQQTDDIFLRFEVYHDGISPRLFAGCVDGDDSTVYADVAFPGAPHYLRVIRSGDRWDFRYSFDGAVWTAWIAFSREMAVAEAGFYGGTYDPSPAFEARADYFMNLEAPVFDQDSSGQSALSDDFNPATAEPNPAWRFHDPYNLTAEDDPGESVLSFDGANASIAVPAGLSHNLWTGAENKAPRVLQPVPNTNFEVEVKFQSTPSSRYQMQGIVVQQTDDIFLRLEVYHDGISPRLFAGCVHGADYRIFVDQRLPAIPLFLRVLRSGDQWTYRYSFDGVFWDEAATFTQAISVAEAGFFAGTYDPAPAFTASVDHFTWTATP